MPISKLLILYQAALALTFWTVAILIKTFYGHVIWHEVAHLGSYQAVLKETRLERTEMHAFNAEALELIPRTTGSLVPYRSSLQAPSGTE